MERRTEQELEDLIEAVFSPTNSDHSLALIIGFPDDRMTMRRTIPNGGSAVNWRASGGQH